MLTLLLTLMLQGSWLVDRPDHGWTRRGLTANGEVLLFTKEGPRPNMIWTRQELRVPEEKYRTLSSVTLVEVDCHGRRSKTLQATDYLGANMTGQSVTWNGADWRYPLPGSMGEATLDYACD